MTATNLNCSIVLHTHTHTHTHTHSVTDRQTDREKERVVWRRQKTVVYFSNSKRSGTDRKEVTTNSV